MTTPATSIKSMTAYARAYYSTEAFSLEWELRSVNHRYLDISLHLPHAFSSEQNNFKEQIRKLLKRGKIEAKLNYESCADDTYEIIINESKVKTLMNARKQIEVLSQKPSILSTIDILSWQGVVETPTLELGDAIEQAQVLLDKALDDLVATRLREGQQLSHFISLRCDEIEAIV